jgi:hypothetical protein
MKHTLMLTLLLCSTAHAAEVYHPTIHMKNGIEVYEGLVSKRTPKKVRDMTPEQYFNYANAENLMARRRNREAAYPYSDRVRYGYVTEGASAGQTRFGGGVGAGGFGGSGGYAGYLGAGDQQSGYGGGFGGYGSGRPGNSMQSAGRSYSKSYTLEYHEWPTFNGGDVEVLNPYVKPKD